MKNSIQSDMEYRFNFFIGIAVEIAYLLAKMVYVIVVYKNNVTMNGLTPDSILLFVGTYVFMTSIYWSLFAANFGQIPELVRSGGFDLLITKPVSLQFITSFKRLELGGMIPNAIGGLILIVIAWKRLHIHTAFNTVGIFSFYIIMGCIASYALYMLPYLISFWTIKAHNVIQVSYSIWDFNNMPMHIYKRWIQEIGFYVIPIFIVTNPAPSIVLGLFDRNKIIAAIIIPLLLLLINRIVWNTAMKKYSSVNS